MTPEIYLYAGLAFFAAFLVEAVRSLAITIPPTLDDFGLAFVALIVCLVAWPILAIIVAAYCVTVAFVCFLGWLSRA